MDESFLKSLIESDSYGMLEIKEKKKRSSSNALESKILEIISFHDKNGSLPKKNRKDINESMLYKSYRTIVSDPFMLKVANEYSDIFQPLEEEVANFSSIEELLTSDAFAGIDKSQPQSLFKLQNVKRRSEVKSNNISNLSPCADFYNYEQTFLQVRLDLESGHKRAIPFVGSEHSTKRHQVFIHKGFVCYLAEFDKLEKTENGKDVNARIKLVYENGLESRMKIKSFMRNLHQDDTARRIVTDGAEEKASGYIYVLKSKSKDESISSIENLHKIGYTKNSVEQRVSNSRNEPTYLMDDVEILFSRRIEEIDIEHFEDELHWLFRNACADITITDNIGIKYRPREWFIVPVEEIWKAIPLILNGEVQNYKYDLESKTLVQV